MSTQYNRTKFACFSAYLTMASAFCLPPILFTTFHETYGVSYTLLGTLVLVTFLTQLLIDLIFTFFSSRFNIALTVRLMPILTSCGMILYAFSPALFGENVYLGLLFGTVLYSVAAGLNEVLISPIVAACPSEHPERDMSLLHSLYGWGVVVTVLLGSLLLKIFGNENWQAVVLIFAALPLFSSVMFWISPFPPMRQESVVAAQKTTGQIGKYALCAACIFLGSCTENLMTNWISNYMEIALQVPKTVGDIAGMAIFAFLLATARVLYSRFGKNIIKTLTVSMACCILCYLAAGLSPWMPLAFAGCILDGFFSSMLWPGTLIMMEENTVNPGVAVYALMAAAGDFGGSIAPQLMGWITDRVAAGDFAARMCERFALTPDAVGLKVGMVISTVFPICGLAVMLLIRKAFRKKANSLS